MAIAGLLMAGGKSSRMGQEKALLKTPAGEFLWERQLKLLKRPCVFHRAIVTGRKLSWTPADIELLEDAKLGSGPLGGITAGLRWCEDDHLIVLGMDLVSVSSELLDRMLGLVHEGKGVVPRGRRGWEPLAAIYPKESLLMAESFLEKGDFKLQNWVDAMFEQSFVDAYEISAEEVDDFMNVNTIEDVRRWYGRYEEEEQA